MIEETIDRALRGGDIGLDGVTELMSITDPKEMETLFEAARKVRDAEFGRKVFTYGFVYFSTYCKNNCNFCYFRRSNKDIGRYRKSIEEVVQLAGSLKDAGINLADLTMGEDPAMYADQGGRGGLARLLPGDLQQGAVRVPARRAELRRPSEPEGLGHGGRAAGRGRHDDRPR